MADKLGFAVEEIEDNSNLRYDLGTDSLDDIELIMVFEKMFDCIIPGFRSRKSRCCFRYIRLFGKLLVTFSCYKRFVA